MIKSMLYKNFLQAVLGISLKVSQDAIRFVMSYRHNPP
jgi:hypothetical protein